MGSFLNLFQPLGILISLMLIAVLLIYTFVTRNFRHWKKKGIPYIKPLPFIGNLKDVVLFRKHVGDMLHEVYDSIKEQPYIGMYFFDQPVLFVKDLDLLKRILFKDCEHFRDRGFTASESDYISHESLFSRKGQDWKDLRTKLTAAFTTGKLKKFFVMEEKASNMDTYFDNVAKKGAPVDIMDICGKYTTDIVASVGFGMKSDSLKNENNEFRNILKDVFIYSKIGVIESLASFVNMPFINLFGIRFVPKKLEDYLHKAICTTIKERENMGTTGSRQDFLDLLIELRNKGTIDENKKTNGSTEKKQSILRMEDNTLVAQAYTFLSAGFETSASTMSFALYHLAKDQKLQNDLRSCLNDTMKLHGEKLSLEEALQSCTYLDMVISETLRMYPLLPFLDRTCTKSYKVPDTDIVIEKGVFVFLSLLGIQRNKNIYPDPEVFNPERFSETNKKERHACAYLPFGAGPRTCLGMRLGLLQAKLGLAHIIMNYELHPCAETPKYMEYNLNSAFLIQPRHGVPLSVKRVK